MCAQCELCSSSAAKHISLPPLINGVLWPRLYILLLESLTYLGPADFRWKSWDVAMERGIIGEDGQHDPLFLPWNSTQVQSTILHRDMTPPPLPVSVPPSHSITVPVCVVCGRMWWLLSSAMASQSSVIQWLRAYVLKHPSVNISPSLSINNLLMMPLDKWPLTFARKAARWPQTDPCGTYSSDLCSPASPTVLPFQAFFTL